MFLADILELEYFPRKRAIRSESTKTHYRVSVKHLGLVLGRSATVDDLTDDTLERFIVWCLNTRKLAQYTVKQRRGYLVALWNWLAKRGITSTWPTVEPVAMAVRPIAVLPVVSRVD